MSTIPSFSMKAVKEYTPIAENEYEARIVRVAVLGAHLQVFPPGGPPVITPQQLLTPGATGMGAGQLGVQNPHLLLPPSLLGSGEYDDQHTGRTV